MLNARVHVRNLRAHVRNARAHSVAVIGSVLQRACYSVLGVEQRDRITQVTAIEEQ